MTRKHPLVTSADGVMGVQPMIKSGCSLDTAFAMRSVSENHDRGVCHHVLGSNVDGQTAEVWMTRVSPAAANPCWERKQVLSFLARADDDPCGGLSRCEQGCWNVRPELRSRFVVQETQRVTTLGHTEVDSTAGLGQTLRTKRPLVGGLSFHCRLGAEHEFIGTQAVRRSSGPGH